MSLNEFHSCLKGFTGGINVPLSNIRVFMVFNGVGEASVCLSKTNRS